MCFTSDHSSALAQVDPARMRLVLEAWIDRDRILETAAAYSKNDYGRYLAEVAADDGRPF